ncbi:putative oxidoreductase [Dyadobacter sp. SG02]|uniref:DoxX family protein n=1 Tax=Dyadobacter sp. SG02 TaxID=1855291 RepID=UPI0008D2C81E|nr:DoxX family protein [Dyadobacter sp. SG02]SEJ73043.1 putative oxidoreductase [Dyadobacter sp. SG02]
MSDNILKPDSNLAALLLRLFLALVLFPHGAQKLLGWFGGFGFEGSMQYFTGQVGLPWVVGFLVIMIEFFGPLALVLGVAVRFSAAAIAVVMAGIIATTFHDHFFMDWFGIQHTEGMEFFLLAIGIALGLIFTGGGVYSIGRFLRHEPSTSR